MKSLVKPLEPDLESWAGSLFEFILRRGLGILSIICEHDWLGWGLLCGLLDLASETEEFVFQVLAHDSHHEMR